MSAPRYGSRWFHLTTLVGPFLLALAGHGAAADWAFSPSLRVSETYDSNISFRYYDKESDFITSIKPKFLLTGRTERDTFNLDSTVNGMIYVDNNQLNRVETYNNASWLRQWTPRFASDLGAAFVKTTALESQLQEAGIRATLADQYNYSVRAKGTYALRETLSLSLGGSAGQTWYPDKEFASTDNALGNLTLAWKRNEFDTFGLDNLYSYKHYYEYPETSYVDSQDVQFFRPGLYWEHTFSETTSLLLGAGYRLTQIEVKASFPVIEFIPPNQLSVVRRSVTTTSRDNSYDFWGKFTKRWTERFSSTLSAGRDQYSDVNGNTYDHMYVGTGMNYALTELTSLGLDLKYDYNSGIEEGYRDTHYFRATPSIDRKLTKDLTLRLAGSYQYQSEKYPSRDGTETADRYLAWVELVWQLPRLASSK